jgi:hypothetical protein
VAHPTAVTSGVIGPLCSVLYEAEVNFGSRVHYIGADGETYCLLIKVLPTIRAWGGELGHFDQAHLEINSNILSLNLHGSILN